MNYQSDRRSRTIDVHLLSRWGPQTSRSIPYPCRHRHHPCTPWNKHRKPPQSSTSNICPETIRQGTQRQHPQLEHTTSRQGNQLQDWRLSVAPVDPCTLLEHTVALLWSTRCGVSTTCGMPILLSYFVQITIIVLKVKYIHPHICSNPFTQGLSQPTDEGEANRIFPLHYEASLFTHELPQMLCFHFFSFALTL